ncbi:AhpC/TSA family protein [Bacteroidales bacterium OttesenSCG-928-B11]|nr:AhpC/TSA family protein [Bacteroidales bacterium OttesenSCG-928-C03]MDL2311814.1 AhpC/TSA family protein [Bacteroidales bacterium OttesenSCG-928-B11]MDL2326181.1 AhpC/TSA family protein [Bacteroidales bacterium OttesenSCG-928-A14]
MRLVKSILIISISILSFSFAFGQKPNVSIKGNVTNLDSDTVQLLNIQTNSPIVFAKSGIDEKGYFELNAYIPETDLYRLSFSEKNYMLCCLEPNEKITIALDGKNLSEIISVSGSKSMALTKELSDTYKSRQTILSNTNKQLQEDQEQVYFNQINQAFVPFQRTNKEIDDYVIRSFESIKNLFNTIDQYTNKEKILKGKEDSLILVSTNLMKSFANDYQKFSSYMLNIRPTYDFPPTLNDKYTDFNKYITQYMDVLDKRHQLLINNMDPVYAVVSDLITKREELVTLGKKDDKETKTEFTTSLLRLAREKRESVTKTERDFLAETQTSENLSKNIIEGAQLRVSNIVQRYQKNFDQENEKINNKMLSLIQENKNNLAVIMFLDIFPMEQNMELHKSVVEALHTQYPTNKTVENKYKQINSPAVSTSIGAKAPEIAFSNPEGKVMKLSDLRGKYVLIDFWASWCGPCRRENPHVVSMYNKYKDKGFDVFSVSLDRTKDAWVKAIETDKLTWPNHVSDLKHWASEAAKIYGVNSIPATFLVDKEGRIIAKNLRGAELTNALKQIFGE